MLTKEQIINKTLECEGGYTKPVTGDKGGETYRGIARNFFKTWPGWIIVDAYKPLKKGQIIDNDTLNEMVFNFYDDEFYKKSKCEEIESDIIRMHHYDMSVNAGIKTSVKILQRAINATYNARLGVDGVIGPKTIGYLNREENKGLLEDNVLAYRKKYYTGIAKGDKKKFLKGWISRANEITTWVKNQK